MDHRSFRPMVHKWAIERDWAINWFLSREQIEVSITSDFSTLEEKI
jgi:hypothetical protein